MSNALKKTNEVSSHIVPVHASKHDRSLRYSLYDGFFYSLMVGFGETYFSAFAVFLGANNFQLAMLSSLPPFCGGVSQFFTLRILDKMGSRQKMVTRFALAQGCFLLPICLSYFAGGVRGETFLFFVICYFVAGQVVGPVWNSWIGDLVPVNQRGSFFGKRNRMVTIGTFLSMVAAGLVLRQFEKTPEEIYGFIIIFCCGVVARSMSVKFLSIKKDPQYVGTQSDLDQFFTFLKGILSRNEGRLILYMASINFAVFVSAAFCVPYLLKTCHFSYTTFVVITSTVALAKVLSSPFWGEVVDSIGARKVVRMVGLLLPLSIFPWAFTNNPYILVGCQLFSGFVWAGYELSTFTFLLDAVRPSERAKVASYSNFISFTAALAGGIVGTLIVSIGPQPLHEYALVFILSCVFRVIAYFTFVPAINEVRVIAPIKTVNVLFKAVGFRTAWGFTNRLVVFRKKKNER